MFFYKCFKINLIFSKQTFFQVITDLKILLLHLLGVFDRINALLNLCRERSSFNAITLFLLGFIFTVFLLYYCIFTGMI